MEVRITLRLGLVSLMKERFKRERTSDLLMFFLGNSCMVPASATWDFYVNPQLLHVVFSKLNFLWFGLLVKYEACLPVPEACCEDFHMGEDWEVGMYVLGPVQGPIARPVWDWNEPELAGVWEALISHGRVACWQGSAASGTQLAPMWTYALKILNFTERHRDFWNIYEGWL